VYIFVEFLIKYNVMPSQVVHAQHLFVNQRIILFYPFNFF